MAAESLADIIAGLSAQGLPPSHPETVATAERILRDYGSWEAYQYDLEVTSVGTHLTPTGRYRPPRDEEADKRIMIAKQVRHHLSLDPEDNGQLLLALLEASWPTLADDSRVAIRELITASRI